MYEFISKHRKLIFGLAIFIGLIASVNQAKIVFNGQEILSYGESAKKEMPVVPTDWDGKLMYEGFCEGKGITTGIVEGRPTIYIAFDTQCSYCVRMMQQTIPLQDKVNFVWMPVAVQNRHSEPQAAAILSSTYPLSVLEEHHANFANKPVRGIDINGMYIADEMRDAVWANTKVFRRSASRLVPFGVYKTPEGQYKPITPYMKTADFEALLGLNK